MHTNLKLIVDERRGHPYGVKHRLWYFAQQANVALTLLGASRGPVKIYSITRKGA